MKIKELSAKKISLIALLIAIIFLSYWIVSGQLNLNQNKKLLEKDSKTSNVEIIDLANGQKSAKVKCQDGSSYDVYYPEGSTDFQALQNSKCD